MENLKKISFIEMVPNISFVEMYRISFVFIYFFFFFFNHTLHVNQVLELLIQFTTFYLRYF